MNQVIIYTKNNCSFCLRAKELLTRRNINFKEIRVDQDETKLEEMIKLSTKRTVPQIFIKDQPIGGYDELAALAQSGKLDNLLNS